MERSEGRERSDPGDEFFSVGTPLHAVRAGYIQRRADDQLFETLGAGRYAHVIAPDRSGKTSLIAATAARLESAGCRVAVLDLAQIGDRDGSVEAGRWYYSVAYRLLRQLRVRIDLQAWWQDKTLLGNRQRLVEFYSEVLLGNVKEPIVVFVDEIQCLEGMPYAEQLLASVRAAHNARTTDPDFSRLCFALAGECDPLSLVAHPDLSPFNITQPVQLDDFSRADLDLFATELNLDADAARSALDRVFFWTAGQPYLTQKLARGIARASLSGDIEGGVDSIVGQQLAGRAALHSEPHMSHIHRRLVAEPDDCEALLNLYGKLRKGIEVPADLGSPPQRRLMAVGLVVIDAEGRLAVRNRLYGAVFTTRWANENLPTRLRVPLLAVVGLLAFALVPFWYTQWLPRGYVDLLADPATELAVAASAHDSFASFPGHRGTANNLYRSYLEQHARASDDAAEVAAMATVLSGLPDAGRAADQVRADFYERRRAAALRAEDRDAALLASLEALVLPTAARRQRAASLVADDYPALLATLPPQANGQTVFDSEHLLLTTVVGAAVMQWSYSQQGVQQRDPWTITALEVEPLLRRVAVDRDGTVSRIGLTLSLSHARLADLRMRVIAPSGRAVEVRPDVEQAGAADEIRIPAAQLRGLVGESLRGTWSVSVRDEGLGVAGQLVSWNLQLNSQGALESFQRGLNIPEPVERDSDNIWFDRSGRYAVARAEQSDSARIWDLLFGEPVRAVALGEHETLLGLDAGARRLLTASEESVNVWDLADGTRSASLAIGAASPEAQLTADGGHLFVVERGDQQSELKVWSLDNEQATAALSVAGAPAHVSVDVSAARVAIADFDRAVRVWDIKSGALLAQFDLAAQPSRIQIAPDGAGVATIYPNAGLALWRVERPAEPILEAFGNGDWRVAFSASGERVAAGRPGTGFQVYLAASGQPLGAALGLRQETGGGDLLAFSADEEWLLTGRATDAPRIWRTPATSSRSETTEAALTALGRRVLVAAPDGRFAISGDSGGHVHVLPVDASVVDMRRVDDELSYIGHGSGVRHLAVAADGRLAASLAHDNSLRAWRLPGGEPLPWQAFVAGSPADEVAFDPTSAVIAVRAGRQLSLFAASDGRQLANVEFDAAAFTMAFGGPQSLYVATNSGELYRVDGDANDRWAAQLISQGIGTVRHLAVSPRSNFLLIVDGSQRATQYDLAAGRALPGMLQLPSAVEDVAIEPNGARVYFRTARWVHQAAASPSGLHWTDAELVPRPFNGAGIVFQRQQTAARTVTVPVMPIVRDGRLEFRPLLTSTPQDAGLFGSRDELLANWRQRLSATPRAAF